MVQNTPSGSIFPSVVTSSRVALSNAEEIKLGAIWFKQL